MRKNKSSGVKGVTLQVDNGKNYYWACRVQGRINFKKRFPFTERGKELAAHCYQSVIDRNKETYYNFKKQTPMESYKDFHSLIEIVVKMNKRIDEHIENPTNLTRINLRNSQNVLKRWLYKSYENPGINKKLEDDIFGNELQILNDNIFNYQK
jgi:hypothetical protein